MLHCTHYHGETMSQPPNDQQDSDDLRPAYRRRAALLWIVVLVAAIAWYGLTAIESSSMGQALLTRRSFTPLDWVVYGLLAGGVIVTIIGIRRCPRCGRGFGLRAVQVCPSCGGRVK